MKIKTIGVIGAGAAGREIACAALLGGFETILEDVSPEMLEQGSGYIERALSECVAREELTPQQKDSALARFSTANRVDAACRVADMLIETVPEEMEVKLEIFTIFDKFAKPNAILASNTSLSIAEIAAITFRAEDCVGMRFIDRAKGTRLLEIVRGLETSDGTVAACTEAGRRMGCEVMVVSETPESIAITAQAEHGFRVKGISE
ncbi:MAG TPA: 3-hydroxyacyl-CoA dehydrogenase NAD-binding domain-containing protein [Terriglobales bacterium]|nr:3-hydroxyacyl-CoA dehydrogenase NAD-binding domain-containing protein [Terriglobales bacterium]